ncbi:MAG TPA: mechanosensitive ion channel family protein [Stellaceae bacterium]|nr:mechanosensitive ion channel family protein [Stellaceae bacterium]
MRLFLPLAALLVTSGIYLFLAGDVGPGGPEGVAGFRGTLRLAAAIALWLSAAWLVRNVFVLAVLRYSARRARTTGVLASGVPKLLIDVGGLVIFVAAIVGILAYVFNQSLGGLLATSGVLAAMIGFAMQRTLSDIFSGMALNAEHSFAIGDWLVTSTGITGKVVEHTWRAVHLVTIDGRSVVVPNSMLISNQIINLNAPERHFRLHEPMCLEYSIPGERAVSILETAMAMTEGVLRTPAPIVQFESCGESGVVYSLNYWVADYPESFVVSRQLMVNTLRLLDQAGFAPAYPKRDVALLEAPQRQIEYGMDLPALLGRVPLLKVLDEGSLAELGRKARPQNYPAAAVIVGEGEPGNSLFVVISGLLDVSRRGLATRPRSIGRLVAGDAFGEMSLLTGAPRSATITAVTPVTLAEITKETLEPILNAYPALILRLSEIQAARMTANMDTENLSPDEREELQKMGFAAVMRQRILQFFGHAHA